MGPVRLGVGIEFLLDGRAYRVVRQLTDDRYIAKDSKFNVEEELSESHILRLYSEGRLRFPAIKEQSQQQPSVATPIVMDDLGARERETIEYRWGAIKPLTSSLTKPTSDDFARRSQELRANGVACSERSLRR